MKRRLSPRTIYGSIAVLLAGAAAYIVSTPTMPATALADAPAATGVITGSITSKPTKYKADVVVHLDKVPGTFRPPKKPTTYDQKGMKFVPRVMAILKGTTVSFLNNDGVRHNVFSPDGEKYDLGTWSSGEARSYTFKKSGAYTQLCNVHPEMLGFIVVLDNPYYAVTDASGAFKIEGVPAGTYTIKTWSEKLKESKSSVTVTAGGTAKVDFSLKK